jgi:hypothetical protein
MTGTSGRGGVGAVRGTTPGTQRSREGRTLGGARGRNGTTGLFIPGTGLPPMGRSLGLRRTTGPGVKERKQSMRRILLLRKS